MSENLINLMDLDPDALKEFAVTHGEKPFRATQLLKWIYQWGVTDFDEMTNIKKDTALGRWHYQVGHGHR